MATTRLMLLHTGKGRTVGQAISDIIDYSKNPQKTDNGRLITSWQCDSRIADAEFLFTNQLRQHFLALADLGSPEVTGIMKDKLFFGDLQPFAAIAFALQDQGVITGLFQMEAETAAAVGGSKDSGLGRQGRDIKPGRAGRTGAGEGAGGNYHPVFLAESSFFTCQMIAEDPGSHDLTTQI